MRGTIPAVLSMLVGLGATAQAHLTYNLSGYGAGIAGSTNGADGSPTVVPPATWTNGGQAGYLGALPANWYVGLHDAEDVHTVQTGLAPTPPPTSLLQQVNAYNDSTDPDLPTDAVLAVGGLSWTDPSNGDQGWGHGLDYGLIHVTPLDTITEAGPVKLTITLTDDPTDAVSPQFAYALYAGWDTSTTSVRHQTFTTNPTPLDNPLGSTGLMLVDFAVAPGPGETLSRSYDVDPTSDGKYTLFIGALGGVSGQYQLVAGLFPSGGATNEELEQCLTDLSDTMASLDAVTADADADGVPDQKDACAATPAGQPVDAEGCSQAEFCGEFPVTSKAEKKACKKADWQNDEPVMKKKDADCQFVKSAGACQATL